VKRNKFGEFVGRRFFRHFRTKADCGLALSDSGMINLSTARVEKKEWSNPTEADLFARHSPEEVGIPSTLITKSWRRQA